MRSVLLGLLALAALGCGGGDDASSAPTTSTAPPTTLISFSDWQAATDAVCLQYTPVIEQYAATIDTSSLEAATASIQGLGALNAELTAALRAIPVPTDRDVDVRRTNYLWTTTDSLLAEAGVLLGQGNFAAFDLKLAEYFERFSEAEDVLFDLGIPACVGTG